MSCARACWTPRGSKARRGELRGFQVPSWLHLASGGWSRFRSGLPRPGRSPAGFSSAFANSAAPRQVHIAFKAEGVHFPRPADGKRMTTFDWTPIRYRNVISVLKNPVLCRRFTPLRQEASIEPRSLMAGPVRPTGTFVLSGIARSCSRVITMATSIGRSLNAIRTQLAANAYGRKDGAKSAAAAAAPCSAAFWFAAAGWP